MAAGNYLSPAASLLTEIEEARTAGMLQQHYDCKSPEKLGKRSSKYYGRV